MFQELYFLHLTPTLNATEESVSGYGAKRLASNESEGCAPLVRNNKIYLAQTKTNS